MLKSIQIIAGGILLSLVMLNPIPLAIALYSVVVMEADDA